MMTYAQGVIRRLQLAIEDQLMQAVPPATSSVALLGFPNHANVGDSAIWLGETAYFRRRGLKVAYACDLRTYSPERLARQVEAGTTLLLHGGGNFGDIWQHHNNFRERVLADFPDVPVVQLPQSIHFGSDATLARTKAAINRHNHLRLLLRDQASLDFARRHFDVPSTLCPDMAFCLGVLDRLAPHVPQLWLWRTDVEARSDAASAVDLASRDVRIVDWLDEPMWPTKFINKRLTWAITNRPKSLGRLQSWIPYTFESLARHRLDRGVRLLSEGHVVVTNRLHAHILCLLLGIPHVVLDNNYGKVSGYSKTWGTVCEQSVFADTIAHAKEAASVLLRQSRE